MTRTKMLLSAACAALLATGAQADEDANMTIDGMEMKIRAAAPEHMENVDEIMSGWVFRSDETQALQLDDFDNPGFVFVDQAIDL